jgi:hypothetical protein
MAEKIAAEKRQNCAAASRRFQKPAHPQNSVCAGALETTPEAAGQSQISSEISCLRGLFPAHRKALYVVF